MLGYGEDALTLWALREQLSKILDGFQDETPQSECLVFYRPSFGRHSKAISSVFGEFDAIIATKHNVYLIESKWDNLTEFKKDELTLRKEQTLRHRILAWYLAHWNNRYNGNWSSFEEDYREDFRQEFKEQQKTIASNSLLARNLEFILTKCVERCKKISSENITNVLLFFHGAKSKPPTITNESFTIIPIDYTNGINEDFVSL